MRELLPCDDDPAWAACPAKHPAPARRGMDGRLYNLPAWPAEIAPYGGPGAPKMASVVLQHAGHREHDFQNIPGWCPLCERALVNGHLYRSWVVPALEAGQLLRGVDSASPDADGMSSATHGIASNRAPVGPSAASGAAEVRPSAASGAAQPPAGAAPAGPAAGSDAATQPTSRPSEPGCDYCRRAFAAGAVLGPGGFPAQEFCDKCGGGIVAGRVFKGHEAYELARAADTALAYKRLHRCRRCAVAILEGRRCDVCDVCRKCHGDPETWITRSRRTTW
ncbi:MAG: hypothetical protein AB1716_10645 [Planctomycetota bacterium]